MTAKKISLSPIQLFKDIFLISIGIASAAFGLESFIIPNHFIDGGVTGISLLFKVGFDIPIAALLLVFNLPFIIMGYRQVSPLFALKSFIAIAVLSVILVSIPFPILTSDKLLVAIFGGFFLGAGIGFSMRGGGVLDGTEILAIALSRRTGLSIGDIILIINILIFMVGIAVIGLEPSLYSVLTYLAASKTIDFILHGIEEYTALTIISTKNMEIREMVITEMGYAVTVYKGEGGKSNEPINILSVIVTRLEVPRIRREIERIDDKAFILTNGIDDVNGGMVKKRALH